MAEIRFFFEGIKKISLAEISLRRFLKEMTKEEGRDLNELNYIFCDDERLLQINKEFLKRDYYTDVISFDLSDDEKIKGDIYISEERIRDNAGIYGQNIEKERDRVIFHGFLHLIGYRDQTEEEKREMSRKENEYIAAYVSRGTKNL
ncbi:MAG: rRNA maturation RNase YbeY [Bacteroidales bacterium]|nr:rRNA maturation RNase YbeY [Bacteroidales bacterium]MCF8386443.1 rRNA maturation RNase YbeY [Bacteroidales bacterium]MCF8397813.1 rRNA maturation RNase YbeY [Bacteroidales bacterium]